MWSFPSSLVFPYTPLLRSRTTADPFLSTDPASPNISTLSLHDALPISARPLGPHCGGGCRRCLGDIRDRKSTRLNSSHANISYAVFCLKKKTRPARPEDQTSELHTHSAPVCRRLLENTRDEEREVIAEH